MDFNKIFGGLGPRLRSERKRLDLTQDQLAEPAGLTKGAVSQWEKAEGGTVPETRYLAAICHRYGISADFVLVGTHSVRVNPLEMQLLEMYRNCSADGKEALLQSANNLHNLTNPERSPANPFSKAGLAKAK